MPQGLHGGIKKGNNLASLELDDINYLNPVPAESYVFVETEGPSTYRIYNLQGNLMDQGGVHSSRRRCE